MKGLRVEENNIDIHKLIKVPDDLSKLWNVLDNDDVKKYCEVCVID